MDFKRPIQKEIECNPSHHLLDPMGMETKMFLAPCQLSSIFTHPVGCNGSDGI